jgi:eukaryotic-like serine/threonine-protein kinase
MAEPERVGRGAGRLRSGLFEIDLTCGELYKSGRKVALQEQPFQVLAMLAERPGELVSRLELQNKLWPGDTYVGFEEGLNTAIRKLRVAFGDSADNPRFIETIPRRGYRFIAPVTREIGAQLVVMEPPSPDKVAEPGGPTAVETDADQQPSVKATASALASVKPRSGARWKWAASLATVCAALVAGGMYWRSHRFAGLTVADTIMVGDFANSTGDKVFDDTLKYSLVVELRQSPFLNLLPDQKISATLKQMNRSTTQPLTEDMAREVGRHTGCKAVLTGSIAGLGEGYLLALNAVEPKTGHVLAQAREQVSHKQTVLRALDSGVVSLRYQLGEPRSTVQKYAAGLEQATMPSLEAMKEYVLGVKTANREAISASLPFFRRAVQLDPGFAMAHQSLASVYYNLGDARAGEEEGREAYQLRDKVSGRQRMYIEANYFAQTTGELEKATQAYELWQQTYPGDPSAYGNLAHVYGLLGNYEMQLALTREELRLVQDRGYANGNLAKAYQHLSRFDEAEAIYKQMKEGTSAMETTVGSRYLLAFARNDTTKMAQMVAGPPVETDLLALQADTEAWYGKLKKARAFTRRAMDSAQRDHDGETAAEYQVLAAARDVETGNREQARAEAKAALGLAPTRVVRSATALILARAGDSAAAEKLAGELDEEFPLATLTQKYWLPTIRAAVALDREDPNKAVEQLRVVTPIELSTPGILMLLCPAYVRGDAYLRLHDGKAAAAEFQKFIDNPGLVANFPWGALARLGLARAYALEAASDPAARDKARKAYQDFLTLWKEADPDLAVLRQAKAEYAKLE